MLPAGYKGMQQTEVKKISDYLDSFIKKEVKIDYLLNEIRNDVADAYKSTSNSTRLNKKNEQISNSEYIKVRNLRSYNNYINKCISGYTKAGNEALTTITSTTNKYIK
ncbi:MAG: hypothetical protein IKE63_03875 [Bacilli bacterium]|nr:hypothetical protein [Bacilli bacterium]